VRREPPRLGVRNWENPLRDASSASQAARTAEPVHGALRRAVLWEIEQEDLCAAGTSGEDEVVHAADGEPIPFGELVSGDLE